jgi:MFS family permease
MIAIASSMTVLGNMIGPVLGGLVASFTGIREMFLVNSAMALLLSLIIWRHMEEPEKQLAETDPEFPVVTSSPAAGDSLEKEP